MLSSRGQQFPQYQHNEQSSPILNELTDHTRKTTTYDVIQVLACDRHNNVTNRLYDITLFGAVYD
jgi:hypothetical protein